MVDPPPTPLSVDDATEAALSADPTTEMYPDGATAEITRPDTQPVVEGDTGIAGPIVFVLLVVGLLLLALVMS